MLLDGVVELDIALLVVVDVDLELAINGGLASSGREGNLPCGPPASVPEVVGVEFGG